MVCVLVASLLSALANTVLNEEIVTDTLGTLVFRLALATARDCLLTRLADSFVQVVAVFALLTAVFETLAVLAVLSESALYALSIADKEFF